VRKMTRKRVDGSDWCGSEQISLQRVLNVGYIPFISVIAAFVTISKNAQHEKSTRIIFGSSSDSSLHLK